MTAVPLHAGNPQSIVAATQLPSPSLPAAAFSDSSASAEVGPLAEGLAQRLLELGLPADLAAPFAVSEEMVAWVRQRVPEVSSDRSRLERLLKVLRESKDRSFEYHGGYTGTAAETFATGRYNCLSFSSLFIGLARALGLPAQFHDVPRILQYERQGQLMVLTRHITAAYGPVIDRAVLEFDVGPRLDYRLAEPIDDLTTLGLYYSNRGTELLRAGDIAAASEQLALAAKLAPGNSQVWANVGVVRRYQGDDDGAEAAYLHALDLDRRHVAAHHNLLVLWRAQGKHDATARLLQELDRRGTRNPMTFVILGDIEGNAGRITEAGRYFERARKLAPDDAEVLAALGGWYHDMGQLSKAKGLMRKATKIDADNPRVKELRLRFDTPE